MTHSHSTPTIARATLYYDRSDPGNVGWAYRYETADGRTDSGEIGGGAGEDATLDDLLLPPALSEIEVARWQPVQHDGPGWEMRATIAAQALRDDPAATAEDVATA